MDFRTATDRATGACITLDDVADATETSSNLIRRARMAPDNEGHRKPPRGWEPAIAKLARARAAELHELARAAEGGGRSATLQDPARLSLLEARTLAARQKADARSKDELLEVSILGRLAHQLEHAAVVPHGLRGVAAARPAGRAE